MTKNLINNLILAVGLVAAFFVLSSTMDAPRLGGDQVAYPNVMKVRASMAQDFTEIPAGCVRDAGVAKREGKFTLYVVPNDYRVETGEMRSIDYVNSTNTDRSKNNDLAVKAFC